MERHFFFFSFFLVKSYVFVLSRRHEKRDGDILETERGAKCMRNFFFFYFSRLLRIANVDRVNSAARVARQWVRRCNINAF